jgi:hypothetical protein
MIETMKCLFFLIFLSSYSHAWSPKLIEAWDKSGRTYQAQMEAKFATFWAGVRRGVHWDQNKGKMKDLLPEGFQQSIPVYIQSSQEQRDLIVFYPGVFGRPNGRISPHVIDGLEKSDVHVAVIPNLLSPTYLIAKPTPKGDPLEFEKINQQNIFKEVIKTINIGRIREIHVIAESLGSLQALTTFAPPFLNDYPIASLTFLWPPLYLDRAVQRFDTIISQSLPKQAQCSYWWKWPTVLWQTKISTIPSGLNAEDKNCLGSWVIGGGFVGAIRDTAEEVIDAKSLALPKIPETFTSFIDSITPEMGPHMRKMDPRLSVNYQLNSYIGHESKMRFVSSIDDFLNEPAEWDTLKTFHPKIQSQIYLFSWGGHSGPVGMDGFIESIAP